MTFDVATSVDPGDGDGQRRRPPPTRSIAAEVLKKKSRLTNNIVAPPPLSRSNQLDISSLELQTGGNDDDFDKDDNFTINQPQSSRSSQNSQSTTQSQATSRTTVSPGAETTSELPRQLSASEIILEETTLVTKYPQLQPYLKYKLVLERKGEGEYSLPHSSTFFENACELCLDHGDVCRFDSENTSAKCLACVKFGGRCIFRNLEGSVPKLQVTHFTCGRCQLGLRRNARDDGPPTPTALFRSGTRGRLPPSVHNSDLLAQPPQSRSWTSQNPENWSALVSNDPRQAKCSEREIARGTTEVRYEHEVNTSTRTPGPAASVPKLPPSDISPSTERRSQSHSPIEKKEECTSFPLSEQCDGTRNATRGIDVIPDGNGTLSPRRHPETSQLGRRQVKDPASLDSESSKGRLCTGPDGATPQHAVDGHEAHDLLPPVMNSDKITPGQKIPLHILQRASTRKSDDIQDPQNTITDDEQNSDGQEENESSGSSVFIQPVDHESTKLSATSKKRCDLCRSSSVSCQNCYRKFTTESLERESYKGSWRDLLKSEEAFEFGRHTSFFRWRNNGRGRIFQTDDESAERDDMTLRNNDSTESGSPSPSQPWQRFRRPAATAEGLSLPLFQSKTKEQQVLGQARSLAQKIYIKKSEDGLQSVTIDARTREMYEMRDAKRQLREGFEEAQGGESPSRAAGRGKKVGSGVVEEEEDQEKDDDRNPVSTAGYWDRRMKEEHENLEGKFWDYHPRKHR